jgi:transcriptional regulator with XRE-family HTH domain
MSDFGERLFDLRRKKGLNQDELAVLIGVSRATISDYERNRSEPNLDTLRRISDFFKVSIDSILGSTHLINDSEVNEKQVKSTPNSTPNNTPNRLNEPFVEYGKRMPKVVTVDSQGNENISFVPVRARAGYLSGYGDPEYVQSLATYSLPGIQNGTYRMFEVEGHSMVTTFHESDLIVGRFVENMAELRSDRVHVVVTKRDGVVVKRVINRLQSDGVLILNSDNQRHAGDYPPIVVRAEEVLEIWYAVAYMSRQMRAPGELYQRLIDVESRLTILENNTAKN